MRLVRIGRGTALLSVGALALAVWACETARNIGGIQRDQTPPVITLTNTAGDTQDMAGGLRFSVSAVDNLALLSVNLTFSGGLIGTLDTTFLGQVKTYSVARQITFPAGSGAGGNIMIVGRATDGAGNFAADTIFIFLRNVQALQVTLISPTPGAIASQGRSIPIQVRAIQNSGIAKIGFLVAPAAAVTNPTVPPNDSIVFLGVLRDTALYTDTLNVVAATGTFDVIGFAEDSAGRRGFTNIVTVTIQSAVNDVTPPLVSHSVGARVEVNDTVIIRATDPSAISWIGFRVDTSGLLLKFDTINVAAGNLTDVTRRASLNLGSVLPPGVLPHQIVVRGYACDGAVARNCSYTNTTSLLPSAPITPPIVPAVQIVPPRSPTALIDTVIVVNGLTVQLAGTGTIADAIYNANLRELYLTNPGLNRVDVFQVANTSFVAGGIPTAGGQPGAIALSPRDTPGGPKGTTTGAEPAGPYLGILNLAPGGPAPRILPQHRPE